MGRIPRRIREVETDGVSIHGLSHTYATRPIRPGVPMLAAVQELMGHAVIKATLRDHNWVANADGRKAVRELRRDVEYGSCGIQGAIQTQ